MSTFDWFLGGDGSLGAIIASFELLTWLMLFGLSGDVVRLEMLFPELDDFSCNFSFPKLLLLSPTPSNAVGAAASMSPHSSSSSWSWMTSLRLILSPSNIPALDNLLGLLVVVVVETERGLDEVEDGNERSSPLE